MRRTALRFGAALAFSEMVAAETYLSGDDEALMRAEGEGVSPHAVQLVGREPLAMAETARRLEGAGAAIIDINMGCPARRVSGALAGAALMRDLDHAERIIDAVVAAVSRAGDAEDAARLGRRRRSTRRSSPAAPKRPARGW